MADSSTTKAKALLGLASSTTFITKSLAQCLHLRRRCHSMKVGCIGSSATQFSSHEMVDLSIVNDHGKTIAVEMVVLPQVSTNLPFCLVLFNRKWKHLLNIWLADPDFGTPGIVDLTLRADVFSRTMFHDRRFGTPGSPSASKTFFTWVLVCDIHTSSHIN